MAVRLPGRACPSLTGRIEAVQKDEKVFGNRLISNGRIITCHLFAEMKLGLPSKLSEERRSSPLLARLHCGRRFAEWNDQDLAPLKVGYLDCPPIPPLAKNSCSPHECFGHRDRVLAHAWKIRQLSPVGVVY